MINFEKAVTPFGIYRISKNYLSFLKEKDPFVLDPEQNLYCGPVLSIYNKQHKRNIMFFVPVVENPTEKWNGTTQMYANGVFGEFDFRRMVPCLEKFITIDENEAERQKFCTENQMLIESIAQTTFNKVTEAQ